MKFVAVWDVFGHTMMTNLSCPNESCGAYVEVYHGKVTDV